MVLYTVDERDNLFLFQKICKQKYKICSKNRQFYLKIYTFSMDYTNKILSRWQNKRPPILPQIYKRNIEYKNVRYELFLVNYLVNKFYKKNFNSNLINFSLLNSYTRQCHII